METKFRAVHRGLDSPKFVFHGLSYQQQCQPVPAGMVAISLKARFYRKSLECSCSTLPLWVGKNFGAWMQVATAIQVSWVPQNEFKTQKRPYINCMVTWNSSNIESRYSIQRFICGFCLTPGFKCAVHIFSAPAFHHQNHVVVVETKFRAVQQSCSTPSLWEEKNFGARIEPLLQCFQHA